MSLLHEFTEVYDERLGFNRCYTADNKLVILLSPGYGSGWSSWAGQEDTNRLLMDASIVRFFVENYLLSPDQNWRKGPTEDTEKIKKFLETKGIYNICMGGFYQLELVYLPKNRVFRISEYNGFEKIEYFSISDCVFS